jgi:hypothetical protein
MPAVPVRQSVRPDYVVCLECGVAARCSSAICALSIASSLRPLTFIGSCRPPIRSPPQPTRLLGAALGGGRNSVWVAAARAAVGRGRAAGNKTRVALNDGISAMLGSSHDMFKIAR